MLGATARACGEQKKTDQKMKKKGGGGTSYIATTGGDEKDDTQRSAATWRPVAAVAAAAVSFAVVSSSLGADAAADLLRVSDAPEQLMSDFNVEFVVSNARTPLADVLVVQFPHPMMMICTMRACLSQSAVHSQPH